MKCFFHRQLKDEDDDDIAEPSQQDYMDEEAPLTIDESITDDEQPDLPKSPIKASDLQEEMQRYFKIKLRIFKKITFH